MGVKKNIIKTFHMSPKMEMCGIKIMMAMEEKNQFSSEVTQKKWNQSEKSL